MSSATDRGWTANSLADELFNGRFVENPSEPPERHRKTLRFWQGEFYQYRDGHYHDLPETEVDVIVIKFLQARNIEIKDTWLKSIKRNLQGLAHVPPETRPDSWRNRQDFGAAIITRNGIVLLDQLNVQKKPETIPHSPVFFAFSRLPYSHTPFARCPLWKQFLNEIMEGDENRVRLLQEFAGYLLVPDLKQQKFLLCVGEGANGKTVFFTMMELLVGRENCSHVSLGCFDQRFALEPTIGKKLITINESGRQVNERVEMVLKSYTSGDAMTIDRKHRAPINVTPTAKIMIATNTLPHFMDKTYGLWRRTLLVPFEVTIPEEKRNTNLVDELTEELPGILNWAIEGKNMLVRSSKFSQPQRCVDALTQYRRDVSSARSFLEENYDYDSTLSGVPCAELYETYRKWCRTNGYQNVNAANFGKELKRVFPSVKKARPDISGRRRWYYAGLRVQPDAEIRDEIYDNHAGGWA